MPCNFAGHDFVILLSVNALYFQATAPAESASLQDQGYRVAAGSAGSTRLLEQLGAAGDEVCEGFALEHSVAEKGEVAYLAEKV